MAPPWFLLLVLLSTAGATLCPDGSACGEKSLCCRLPGKEEYGCCPEGEVVSHSLPMMLSQTSCFGPSGCPDEYSCVTTPQGGSSCCPIAHGRSCRDGRHCCSAGSYCSDDGHFCIPGDEEEHLVPCPDGSSCPDGSTCCEQVDQTYGCCSILSAVCCSDHLHCCPAGTTCDLVHKKCASRNGEGPLLPQMPAIRQESRDVQCDDLYSCPDGQTCCRLASGDWGCCPIAKAVCCDDHEHCCPPGYTCSGGDCQMGGQSIPGFSKTPALRLKARDVQCDDLYSCPDGQTCCRLASGDWGCCPIAKAVCCDDHEHCCPPGYTCSGGDCQMGGRSIPGLSKTPALRLKARDVQCDDLYSCPDGQTCCRLASGDWGCCPIAKAVCCDDHEHCCPPGYTCSGGDCQMGGRSIPGFSKTPALRLKDKNVKCDDLYSCPDGQTCCRLESGRWGCCPIAQAVCCDDHEHCCPPGYTCSGGDCQMGGRSIPGLSKTPALRLKARDVQCDDLYSCPDGQTCCRLASGDWGCCPIAKAVCCDDHEHCCPPGYTCSGGDCQMGGRSIPGLSKTPALRLKVNDVPCDDLYSCADGQTCCRLASGDWGCCPIAKAVCCDDHEHCCPPGFTCSGSQCIGGGLSIPWFSKTPALRHEGNSVKCDDSFSCGDGQTCCRMASGEWGCCDMEKAVCCSDHEHCCPSGYSCNLAAGTCEMPQRTARLSPSAAASAPRLNYVWCDAQTSCFDGQTCCRGLGGVWNCCLYTQGVCCPDMVHCCPYGYVCLAHGASCGRSGMSRWDGNRSPLL